MGKKRGFILAIAVVVTAVLTTSAQNPFELKYRPTAGEIEPRNDSAVLFEREFIPETSGAADSPTQSAVSEEDLIDSTTSGGQSLAGAEDTREEIPDDPIEIPTLEELVPIALPDKPVSNILILSMLGIAILVLTWAVNVHKGFLKKIYRGAMNANLSALLLREQKFASSQYLYYIVYSIFFINGALFLYLLTRYGPWSFGYHQTPLIAFAGLLLIVFLTRHIFLRLIGSVFRLSGEARHFNFNILLYNILAGVSLIPINLFLAFGPENLRLPVVYIGLGVLALLYLLRQLRGLGIAGHYLSTNTFQFFVYLCAVEILPVLALFKYFVTN